MVNILLDGKGSVNLLINKMTSVSFPLSKNVRHESETFFKEFIDKYKNLPQLWDPNHQWYKNKYKRNAGYDVLLAIMRKYDEEATRYHVRQKLNSLRSNYRKDLRRYLSSKEVLPNGDEVYSFKPSNWKFYALLFLNSAEVDIDDTLVREQQEYSIDESNFEESSIESPSHENQNYEIKMDQSEAEEEDIETDAKQIDKTDSYQVTYTPSTRKRKLKIPTDPLQHLISQSDTINKEYEAIGTNVAYKLKRMNEQQRFHAEILINKVLINGLKNNLTDDTDLTDLQVLDVRTFHDED